MIFCPSPASSPIQQWHVAKYLHKQKVSVTINQGSQTCGPHTDVIYDHISKVLYWTETVDAIWVQWAHSHVQETGFLNCFQFILLEAVISMWIHCGDKVMDMVTNNSQVGKKYLPFYDTSLNSWYTVGWIPAFMLFMPFLTLRPECCNRNYQTRQCFSHLQLFNFCVNCSVSFLSLADWRGTQCGLLLPEPICLKVWHVVLAFKDILLHLYCTFNEL